MPDREKVITHFQDAIEASGNNNKWRFVRVDIIEDALELLKDQEPVQVKRREAMHMLFWCCGFCGVAITEGDKFCRMCGRKVKWE